MEKKILTDEERIDWLRLIRTSTIGPKTFEQLMFVYNGAGWALQELPNIAKRGGMKAPIKICTEAQAEQEIENLGKLGGRIIASCEPDYPELLSHIDDAPPIISVIGDIELFKKDCIAFVGARNASLNGKKLTKITASQLGKEGFTIVSGLARGIDTAAHEGSLETGTIAVVAGGIDIIYPKENAGLYEQIKEKGAVIAESAFGATPRAESFPRRNRIISGLSKGAVIIEAAKRSGSLITARMALEQNREVMAFPGSPLDPRAQGPNSLIQQGATLVTSAEDIKNAIEQNYEPQSSLFEPEEVMFKKTAIKPLSDQEIDEVRRNLHEIIGYTPVSVDDLVVESGASINAILTILLELEIADRLERHPGNKVSLLGGDEVLAG